MIALAVSLAAAACGSSGQPQPSPAAQLTKHFTNAALGVSFRYPSSWRVRPVDPGRRSGDGAVVSGATGGIGILVYYSHDYAFGHAPRPERFAPAGTTDLRRLAGEAMAQPLWSGYRRVDGLRLASVEFVSALAPTDARATGLSAVHDVWCDSAKPSASRSYVRIAVYCPPADWPAEKATLQAVLDSVRFSRPAGG